MNEITYHREGDYLIPNLYLPKQPEKSIGKYGRLRLNFVKEHKKGLYTELLINGTLKQHLIEIDKSATSLKFTIFNSSYTYKISLKTISSALFLILFIA